MKQIIIGVVLVLSGQAAFGIFGLGSAKDLVAADDYCKKLAQVDRPDCYNFIKGKKFRSDFLDVCFDVQKKMSASVKPTECLEKILNKSTPNASTEQAEICSSLIASRNAESVTGCLEANVIKEFAEICERYADKKSWGATSECIHAFSDVTADQIDMAHFNGGCKLIKDHRDFAPMASCLIRAETNKADRTGATPRLQERIQGGARQ